MTITKASSTYFAENAARWDALRAGYFTEKVREAALAKAYLRPEMIVADVGAGTGFMAEGLAGRVRRIHLLDGSAEMLEEARRKLQSFDQVSYHLMEGEHLPLPEGSMDAVFANMYLHHCSDPAKAIWQMVRLLKPGGRLVITDLDSHSHTWMQESMADTWLGFDRGRVRAWFTEAGLVNGIVDSTGENCCAEREEAEEQNHMLGNVKIGVFVAVGTRRMEMRDAVQKLYGTAAETGCGCSFEAITESASGTQDCCQKNLAINSQACCQSSEINAQSCCQSQTSHSGCCGKGEAEGFSLRYTPAEFGAVPAEAAEFSLGCGNPLAFAALRGGEVVVDIGSGGGMDVFLAASKVGVTGRVIGVDMTQQMLERARATAVRRGYTNVEFRQGQAEALPVEDASVDMVISNCVINLCEDKGKVFQEAFRILRPGGRLEVSDMVAGGSFLFPERADAGNWAECISGALPEMEYLDLIRQAGFIDIQVHRSSEAISVGGTLVWSAIVRACKI